MCYFFRPLARQVIGLVFGIALCVFASVASAQGTSPAARNFDHLTTGFELTGTHRQEPCESCHVNAVFKGTPRDCNGCHTQGTRVASTSKPATHIPSTDNCGACHSTAAFVPASSFTHTEVRGSCATCHNNVRAAGKSANHVATNLDCSTCHNSFAWKPARFDHASNTSGCATCHNGVAATGKNTTHITSMNLCESCHTTMAWAPVTHIDHTQVSGACFTCHNGTVATGKTATHIASDTSCDACHTTSAWKPAIRADHAHVTGSCSTCHNGVNATGKPTSHLPTTQECGSCHTTLAWKPAAFGHVNVTGNCNSCHNGTTATGMSVGHMTFPVNKFDCNHCHTTIAWTPDNFAHAAAGAYPGDHSAALALTCLSCHTTNQDTVTWRSPAYKPYCAGCHERNFSSGAHPHYVDSTTGKTVNYKVSEIPNCSGACHVYTDQTLTKIKNTRSGPQHRVNGRQFGG